MWLFGKRYFFFLLDPACWSVGCLSTFGLIRSKIILFRIFTGTDNKCQSCRSSFVSQSLEFLAVVCGSASNAFASIKLGPGDFPLFNIFFSSIISFIDGMEQTIATWYAAGRMSVIVSGAGLFNRSVKWSTNLCLKFVLLVYLRCFYFLSFTCFFPISITHLTVVL